MQNLKLCSTQNEWDTYHRIKAEQIITPLNIIYNKNHPDFFNENHFHFILYDGSNIFSVAHIQLLNKNEVALRTLATDLPYQNHGFGTKMM